MRIVFVGASAVTLATARMLIHQGHEVVLIEQDKNKQEEIAQELDCGLLLGDGTRPDILKEVSPSQCDLLLCLTNNDQRNLIASLVGRSLGFPRVITRIESEEFELICHELGLKETILPSRTIARYLADLVAGAPDVELAPVLKGEARLFSCRLGEGEPERVSELDLPAEARVICLYRAQQFLLAEPDTRLHKGDELVILTHSRHLPALEARWAPSVMPPADPASE